MFMDYNEGILKEVKMLRNIKVCSNEKKQKGRFVIKIYIVGSMAINNIRDHY